MEMKRIKAETEIKEKKKVGKNYMYAANVISAGPKMFISSNVQNANNWARE